MAGLLRLELQKEEMRALFWRPGPAPAGREAPTVLVAASKAAGGLKAAAAVVAARAVLQGEVRGLVAFRRL